MEFEWDEVKRVRVWLTRKLDFIHAGKFFDGRPVVHEETTRFDEFRSKSITMIEGKTYTLIWTWRDDKVRVITMRRSHEREERAYRSLHL